MGMVNPPSLESLQTPLILASASPRRHELLASLGVSFEVRPAPLPEPAEKPADLPAASWAEALAYFKARCVAEQHPQRWVLGADTVVACAGELLGKPRDLDDARRMLRLQAGVASDVITALALIRWGAAQRCRRWLTRDITRVWMRDDPQQIEAYLQSGDWRDKAGAYGIQNVHDRLILRIAGEFENVVGLPLTRLRALLACAARHALEPA